MTPQVASFNPTTVKVGDGVTEPTGSDRRAATVTWVSKSGKTIRYTMDEAKMKEGCSIYGSQDYDYTSVEEQTWQDPFMGEQTNARKAIWNERRQMFVPVGAKQALRPGRNHYYDPHF